MAALRCLIDSMVFDMIADDGDVLATIDRLTSARRVELLAAAETMREIAATPDRGHRRRLQKVRVLVVAPARGDDPATLGLLRALSRAPGVSEEDARIAVAAAQHGVPLVTEDRALRAALAAIGPERAAWTWERDLRPRIAALGDAHPPVPRRG